MLTQLSTIKSRLGLDPFDTKDDALITNFGLHASGRFSRDCNRIFDRAAATTYQFRANEILIRPDRYPIELVSSFDLKTREIDGWIAVAPAPDFIISPQKNIIELVAPLGVIEQAARVTYTAGYVLPGTTPGAGQTALPDEIEQSCIEQVAYWYQNRNRLGLTSITAEGGAIQQFASLDLLPHVKAVLKKYERWLC